MSDKPAAKPAEAPAAKKKEATGGVSALLGKTPVMLGGVMLIEALVLFAGFKFLGASPKSADASIEHGAHGEHGDPGKDGRGQGGGGEAKTVEIPVVDFRAPNKLRGQTLLIDVSIFAVVGGDHEEKVRKAVKEREALIKDRIRTIIAQSDPEKVGGGSEPGLETLRRQVKVQLDEIIGEGSIQEVLVPRCIPYRSG